MSRANRLWTRLGKLGSPGALLLLALFTYYLSARQAPDVWPAVHGDGHYTFMWARSLAYDGDMRLGNDYKLCGDPWSKTQPAGPGLEPRNTWPVGPAYIWAPLVAIGRWIHPSAAHSSDPKVAGGCLGPITDLAMASSALAAVLALGLAYRCAKRYVPRRAALLAVLLVGLASPIRYYATFAPSYSHALSAFAVAAFLERWDAGRRDRSLAGWAVLGGLLGFAMAMRAQTLIVAVLPLAEWTIAAWAQRRTPRRLLRHVGVGLLFVGTALLVFFPQMYAWKIGYGQWLAMPQGSHYVQWGAPKFDGTLFSTLGGLLLFSPLLYASVLGIGLMATKRSTRFIGGMFLGLMALSLYVNASVWDFWGSGGYPGRRFSEMTMVFVVGASAAIALAERLVARFPRATVFGGATLTIALFSIAHRATWSHLPERESRSDELAGKIASKVAADIRDSVGNPLAWPASIPFAIRYGAHPKHYDLMTGYTAYYEDWVSLQLTEHRIDLGRDGHGTYLSEGFATQVETFEGEKGRATSASHAKILVPMFRGNADSVMFRWRSTSNLSDVTVRWNGKVIYHAPVATSWTQTRMALAHGTAREGVNEVEIEMGDLRLFVASLDMSRKSN